MIEPARVVPADLEGLPGAQLIVSGLRDLSAGVHTAKACLVLCATIRLRDLGLPLPEDLSLPEEPEMMLYKILGQEHEDPYYRYNSMRQELDSFLAALQGRLSRLRASAAEAQPR